MKEATENVIESEAGCTEQQLGDLNEPALPNCSKAVACCKFVKGECGEVTLFTPPDEVIQACNLNQAVLTEVIHEYQAIGEGTCPDALKDEACKEGTEQTRANYVKVVDQGDLGQAEAGAPSCLLIVDQTINVLNEELGENAAFLPKACEAVAGVVSPQEDVVEGDR